MTPRTASLTRRTNETNVVVTLGLDGTGLARVTTGIGFFDHMLAQLARHSDIDLDIHCDGDLDVDGHHTVEDVGITLGQALAQALGDKAGIARFGHAYAPMDETLARAVVDISGRPYLVYEVANPRERIGNFAVEMAEHFWRSFAFSAGVTLHITVLYGRNQHHILEAAFKATARALGAATRRIAGRNEVPSTKGVL
ncbi:MAG: imidazoleglycerol-phosphate dehydratase HisB [Chloracidobacterium sp.]|nr:imidazoleglycerol-phosphate dehydratase HisB [Chloracidobacterium sp.]MDW8217395.1 imidazoleglycerol-phosphate dehydratase HisB [Acidobacteriota bacterium]